MGIALNSTPGWSCAETAQKPRRPSATRSTLVPSDQSDSRTHPQHPVDVARYPPGQTDPWAVCQVDTGIGFSPPPGTRPRSGGPDAWWCYHRAPHRSEPPWQVRALSGQGTAPADPDRLSSGSGPGPNFEGQLLLAKVTQTQRLWSQARHTGYDHNLAGCDHNLCVWARRIGRRGRVHSGPLESIGCCRDTRNLLQFPHRHWTASGKRDQAEIRVPPRLCSEWRVKFWRPPSARDD